MSTTHTQTAVATAAEPDYLSCSKGWKSWLLTLDHKRIGVMYLIGVLCSFALGGFFALMVRTELFTPGKTIIEADTYNQMFTLHGAVMVFRARMNSRGAATMPSIGPILSASGRPRPIPT